MEDETPLLTSFRLQGAVTLPPVLLCERLVVRCLEERDRRWLPVTAFLTDAALFFLSSPQPGAPTAPAPATPGARSGAVGAPLAPPTPPSAGGGASAPPAAPTWSVVPLVNTQVHADSGGAADGLELSTARKTYSLRAPSPASAALWLARLRALSDAATDNSLLDLGDTMARD
jgi:hypothetical protein